MALIRSAPRKSYTSRRDTVARRSTSKLARTSSMPPVGRLVPNRRITTVAAWILSVLIFSLAYWWAWVARPDSFILNREFNLTPYDQLLAKLWSPSAGAVWDSTSVSTSTSAIELDEFSKSVGEIDREATSAQIQLRALEREQAAIELAAKAVYEEHSAKLWSNVDKYKQKAVAAESAAVERATSIADALTAAAQRSPSPAAAIAAANARVDLAKAQYALAVRQADAGEYALHHLREFADPDATAKFGATEAKLATLRQEQNDLMRRLGELRGHAFKRLEDWYSTRTGRLEWIDFLYFSVGVSTTTTFGDIVPNSRLVRVFVLTQLIFSVLLVGYLVSLLGRPRGTP